MLTEQRSKETYRQLCDVIPGGVNSPVRSCKGVRDTPMVAESGQGDMIYDVDGNGYIDYCCSWGPLIHGHAHPAVIDAASRRLQQGSSFGVTTAIEAKIAQKVVDLVDSVEKIRFVSSGTEATMTAVRLARGYTGRPRFVKFTGHYHGHSDFFLVNAGSGGLLGVTPTATSAGIPDDVVKHTVSLDFNDLEGCRAYLTDPANRNEIAAVILEPVAGNMGVVPATREFMAMLREVTQEIGALLLFDEVMNCFRLGIQGAQSLYPEKPDLTCFGKVIGGGFPSAAVGGSREIMDYLAPLGPVYQAGTLSGNPVAMEAGYQTLLLCEEPGFYENLAAKTRRLTKPIHEALAKTKIPCCLQEEGSMLTIFFGQKKIENMLDAKKCDLEIFGRFFRYLFDRGIYIPPSQFESWFVSSVHTDEHIDQTRDHILEFIEKEL
ncbi:MAG: glutamate-1-semialdehyde 2,1-aminomutase [Chlamydiales bacterium]|nr:glutamate-1-semialdehyde 2,1-aminomutase [Chlamydiia bacterium]MCP5507305.1 glutamate-1-semialdehyde 2,1-aminomutase [Chlamydiales bacterium]